MPHNGIPLLIFFGGHTHFLGGLVDVVTIGGDLVCRIEECADDLTDSGNNGSDGRNHAVGEVFHPGNDVRERYFSDFLCGLPCFFEPVVCVGKLGFGIVYLNLQTVEALFGFAYGVGGKQEFRFSVCGLLRVFPELGFCLFESFRRGFGFLSCNIVTLTGASERFFEG